MATAMGAMRVTKVGYCPTAAPRRPAARMRCSAVAATARGGLTEQYQTLKVRPGATESEVKKAFRRLALQYHPDVCKGNNCGVKFNRINEAYQMVLNNLRHDSAVMTSQLWPEENNTSYNNSESSYSYDESDETDDGCWDDSSEYMGYEGGYVMNYAQYMAMES